MPRKPDGGVRPFSRSQEARQWSHWNGVADARPDPRPENDPDALESLIATTAARFARGDEGRDGRGRWTAGGRSNPDRDVAIHLTRVAYGLTVREVGVIFGLKCRKAVMRAIRRGREAVERDRGNPAPPILPPKNEPKW